MSIESLTSELLLCMCTELAERTGWEGDCCLEPGQPALLPCTDEDCGRAWARLVRMYPSQHFPRPDANQDLVQECGLQQWALVLDMGAVRCVCADATNCGCADKAADASRVLADTEAGLQGIMCCVESGRCGALEYRMGQATAVGPDAGCGGFRVEVTVAYTMSCCPPAESP